ncbi:MAG: N-acetylmuramoyl-L-alanine amidase family protein [Acidimicrobiales bacterium]
MRRCVAACLVVFLVAACGGSGTPDLPLTRGTDGVPTSPPVTTGPSTTAAPATTAPPTTAGPPPVDAAARAVVTPAGVVLPVNGVGADGYTVQTPCGNTATVTGRPITSAQIVLDPGHGGSERGAVGPNGLTEGEVNLAIAEEAKSILESAGHTVVLTRTADYRIALRTRAQIATNLAPLAFVSIHHNAEPDGPWPGPGSETYYQIASPDSKRLAGLLWEEVVAAFAPFGASWQADTDAGAKYRLASSGGDYYGILRRTAGVAAVLSEAAFISNPSEEAMLATPAFRRAEAQAIATAVTRFVSTDDPGSGFTEPYPRTEPAGPGGGVEGCVDPEFG